ncbi:MAG: N-acetyltransferase family protein [Halobacterium sp.]
MDVRPIESPTDLQGVNRVNVRAWREAYDGILPDALLDGRSVEIPREDATGQFDRIRERIGCFLVAEDGNGEIRGYVYVRWGDDTKGFVGEDAAGLKEIYVEPDYWGDGIGTHLLEHALDRLPDSVEAVRLEMLSGNDVARGFYESHGFEQVDTTQFELDGEAYPTDIYEKRL